MKKEEIREKVKALNEELKELDRKIKVATEGMNSLKEIYSPSSDMENTGISEIIIKELKSVIKKSEKKKDKAFNMRKSLREICPHEYKYSGHDSHYDWYECGICGEEYEK